MYIYIYTYVYTYIVGIISFISMKATMLHLSCPESLIFIWMSNPSHNHLQSSQGSKQLDHIPVILSVAYILSLRSLGGPTPHMGQLKLDFK